jgi:hypothetical protein
LNNHENKISSDSVKKILKKRGFFDDVRNLSELLKPIKNAILVLESNDTTLADCYLQLLKIATCLKSIPATDYQSLKNSCIKVFNKRYKYHMIIEF